MGRLTDHFENRTRETHNEGWSALWESSEELLWDRGKPSPALIDFVEQREEWQPDRPPGRRLKALVPACGRGYEVVMLALHGIDAYGLEVSQKAVEAGNAYAQIQLSQPSPSNFGSAAGKNLGHRGTIKFVVGDFFKTDWEIDCGGAPFDLIYDYTFLCAILPEMRLDWARRMKQLLAPSGILVCLEFPLYKDPTAIGPPYGLKGVYWNLLAEGQAGLVDRDQARNDDGKPLAEEAKLERLLYYQPSRTYKVGEGTDMISVWKHKQAPQ